MRLSTALINEMKGSGISSNQSDLNKLQEKMNAKKNFLSPADDPLAHRDVMRLKQAQSLREQFTTMRNSAKETMDFQASIMDEISSIVKNINDTMISGMNEVSNSDQQRKVTAEALVSAKNRLLSLVNKQDNSGNYVFSGDKSDVKPYELINGQLVYQGGDSKVQQIDQFTNIKVNVTGKDALSISSTEDVFSMLDKAITAFNTPIDGADEATRTAQRDTLTAVKGDIEKLTSTLSHSMAKNGLQIKEVESLNIRDKEISDSTKDQIAEIQALNQVSGFEGLLNIKTSLSFAYQSFGLMKDMSILNYVK
nr:hypothetical protein [uncultured Moellerella sp.]